MKKKTRKLTLHRETLRHLQTDNLRKVVGGALAEPTYDCTEGCTDITCAGSGCCSFGYGTCDTCDYNACTAC